MNKKIFKPVAALAAAGLLVSAPAMSDPRSGLNLRAGAYFDEGDPLVGIDYQIPVSPRWSVIPNAEYVFVEAGDLYTVNVDTRYELNPSARNQMWVGAGAGLIHRDNRFVDDSDPAVNLLWGMDFNNGESWTPFVSTKAILSDESEFAFNFGIRFGSPSLGSTTAQTSTTGNSVASTR